MKSDHSSLFRTHSDIQLLCIFNVKLESITFTSVEVKKNRIFINLRLFFFLFYGTRIIISIQQIVLGICLWNDTDTFLFLVKITCNFILFYFILFKHQRITVSSDSLHTSFLSREFQNKMNALPLRDQFHTL